MKLELKHLAPYLPYGLKGNLENLEFYDTVINKELYRLETGKTEVSNVLDVYVIVGSMEGKIEDFKPILRPLSDLTKEIEHNGKKFVPINTIKIFTDINHFEYVERFIYDEETLGLLPYWVIELLLEWNLDIFGLIPHGLAIDINTLNK